ncbi:MAG TPA: DUF4239 domain-containing protein [Xanthobacteraceae bacterium]|nr:DUF4239 domain-containing protein [Xanthobacteraceae bacterium]
MLGGVLLGALLRHTLPQHHLSKESQDVVRLGVGLIATIGALVLGLLIASAKSSFDTQAGQIKQITAGLIQLDNLLEQYGPEAVPIRRQIRSAIDPLVDRLWREKASKSPTPFVATAAAEKVYAEIQSLTPQNDMQRSLQARAIQVSNDFAQTRLLLFVESDNQIPTPFLAVLVFWLIIIFASFSLFSPLNATVFGFLSLFALSASCAIYLILELSEPFKGLMMISSAPLRNALGPL